MIRREEVAVIQSRRRWLGVRVWTADADGTRREGTLWFEDDQTVQIREDGRVGLRVLPKASEGTRWGLLQKPDKA